MKMKKFLAAILLAGSVCMGPAAASVAEAAAVYAYSGKGIEVYVDTSSITTTRGGFNVYVSESNGHSYTLMQFYQTHGDWKFTSTICGSGYIYNVPPAQAVFNVCQQYL